MVERRYAWYVLLLLSAINFMNYADRQVLFALFPHVQDELGFSDLQLGMLGAAFLIVHSICSVPGGWLADHWYKRKVIALGVFLWSVATVLGAVTRGFVDLFFYRALVGVGEALYHPAANAMISDYFPSSERGRAMGIFSVGMVLGGGGGMIAGTFVAEVLGWRYAFLVAGIPGFLLAAMAWYLREAKRPPPAAAASTPLPVPDALAGAPHVGPTSTTSQRQKASALAAEAARRAARAGGEAAADWKRLFRTKTVLFNFAGGICVTFCIGGIIAWTVSFLDRYFVRNGGEGAPAVATAPLLSASPHLSQSGFALAFSAVDTTARTAVLVREVTVPRAQRSDGELARVSASFGIVALSAGILGAFVGGLAADHLMRRRRSGRLIVSALGFLLGVPFALGGIFADTVTQFLVCLAPGMFFFSCYMGPSIAILHDVTPYHLRGTVAAWYIFLVHLLGDAISPPIIGWVSQLSELRYALIVPLGVALIGVVFFLIATRYVGHDMDVAEKESARMAARAGLAHAP